MPTICILENGTAIYMYSEANGKHNTPHIHCIYSGSEIVIDFQGQVLAGSMPPKVLAKITEWIRKHKTELAHDWALLQKGNKPEKIMP